jgi:hypothetical protein
LRTIIFRTILQIKKTSISVAFDVPFSQAESWWSAEKETQSPSPDSSVTTASVGNRPFRQQVVGQEIYAFANAAG